MFTVICLNFIEVNEFKGNVKLKVFTIVVTKWVLLRNIRLKIVSMISYTSQFSVFSVLYRKE